MAMPADAGTPRLRSISATGGTAVDYAVAADTALGEPSCGVHFCIVVRGAYGQAATSPIHEIDIAEVAAYGGGVPFANVSRSVSPATRLDPDHAPPG